MKKKYWFLKKLPFVILLLGLVFPSHGQQNKDRPSLEKNGNAESLEFDEGCDIFGKFRFRLLGQEFSSGQTAFICPLQLPTEIEVFHKDGLIPNYVSWSGATFSNVVSQVATIEGFANAVGGTITCEVSVDYPDRVKELKLKINLDAIPIKSKNGGPLAYDDNEIEEYPSYRTTPNSTDFSNRNRENSYCLSNSLETVSCQMEFKTRCVKKSKNFVFS